MKSQIFRCALTALLSLSSAAMPAIAGNAEATAAVSRADAKIEIVSRHSSQPGMESDQSLNMSRRKLEEARDALQKRRYDNAEMLADEAAILAELTAERAKLAALQNSRNDVTNGAAASQ